MRALGNAKRLSGEPFRDAGPAIGWKYACGPGSGGERLSRGTILAPASNLGRRLLRGASLPRVPLGKPNLPDS